MSVAIYEQNRQFVTVRCCSVVGCHGTVRCRDMCSAHYARLRRSDSFSRLSQRPLAERFWSKVSFPCGGNGCWLWTGSISSAGYGSFRAPGTEYAHVFAYHICIGEIPKDMELDHVATRGCTNQNCVNPAHLEPVTHAENMRRSAAAMRGLASLQEWRRTKTHCPSGHPYSGNNLYVTKQGYRACNICRGSAARAA